MFCHAKKTISNSQAELTQRSVSCLCIVYYRAEDVYCPVARNKQYGRQPSEKSLLAQILNSGAETDRTETKAHKKTSYSGIKFCHLKKAFFHHVSGIEKGFKVHYKLLRYNNFPQYRYQYRLGFE